MKGGVHLSSSETEFQFELNETLYFDNAYEVKELVGISLNPEITIHPYDTYVSIRGEIQISGEYVREPREAEEEENLDIEDFQTKRFIEEVIVKEDDITEFSHRFPIDISVPAYRINTVDDLSIEIMTFDYEIPISNKLQLTAIAAIHGMKAEIDLLEEKKKRDSEETTLKNEESTYFEFGINQPEELETEDERAKQTVEEEQSNAREKVEDHRKTTSESLADFITELPDEVDEKKQEDIVKVRAVSEKSEPEVERIANRSTEEEKVEDVSYLADMFRGDDEERFTKMRLCIVQAEDTIESIAEKFKVSTLQLIKQNKLDEDYDVSEGQLLYIPNK